MSWATVGRNPDDKPAATHDYNWLREAQEAESRIGAKANSLGSIDHWRYAGHCYFQAAFQAPHREEFGKRMIQAGDAFKRAAEASGSESDDNSRISRQRYMGLSNYCNAQTAIDNPQTLTRLHEAFKTLADGWTLNPAKAGIIAPVLPIEMLVVSNDLMNYEPNILSRLPVLKQSLNAAEPTQLFHTNLNKDQQLVLAIERVEALHFAWTQLEEYLDRESAGSRCIEEFTELRHHVKEAADPRIPSSALWVQMESAFLLPTTSSIIEPEDYLASIKQTDDHLALGGHLAAKLRMRVDELFELEDPAKASRLFETIREETKIALGELRLFRGVRRFRSSPGYVLWNTGDVKGVYARWFSKTPDERLRLVREAVEASYKIAEEAPPTGIANQGSNLGSYLYDRALLEEEKQKKRSLEEAWKGCLLYQQGEGLFYSHWDWGESDHYFLFGQIKRETARLSNNDKQGVLTEAVSMFQNATDTARKVLNSPLALEPNVKHRVLSRYLYHLGSTQLELYQTTRNPPLLDEALKNLHESSDFASKQTLPTRVAESLIKIGDAYAQAGKFEEANNALREAAKRYREAATKYPGLSSDFQDQARHLEARGSATLARDAYLKTNYKDAAKHYREASDLLEKSHVAGGLAGFYDAWALASEAEELGQTDPEEAGKTLSLAVSEFSKVENSLDTLAATETGLAPSWRRLATLGREYVETRLLLDQAHLLEKKGQLAESSNHLSKAADQFDKLARTYDDIETQDLMRGHALICRASQAMIQAEQTLRPDHYDKAASLFQEAQKISRTRTLASLVGGWAACCKALAIGIRYKDNPEQAEFQKMKRHLAIAHSNFADAGSTSNISWLAATGRMYDAIAYLAEAESTLNPTERDNQYRQAEEQIQQAIDMFQRAGYTARKDDAERLLQSIKEKHTTLSLGPIPAASIAQSAASVTTPTAMNQSLTSHSLEPPQLHAALHSPESTTYPEKIAQLTLTILNPGQTSVGLVSVENLIHAGLTVEPREKDKRVNSGILSLGGKRLSPLETLQIEFHARPSHPGKYILHPTIRFVNSQGQQLIHQSQPLVLEVGETGLRAWLRGPRS